MILECKLTFHYVFRVELYSLRVQGQYFLIHLNDWKLYTAEASELKLSF